MHLNVPRLNRMIEQNRRYPDWVLAIDGGGTHTDCVLAELATGTVVARGDAGPSNMQSVGVDRALAALQAAIDAAFAQANRPRGTVAAACLGLAGVDWDGGISVIEGWSRRIQLADRVSTANDATLLLTAGTPEGHGLAVIAGTGSIAFVQTPDGRQSRCGGWGYTLGDEGSAYHIALAALRAACRSFDGTVAPTKLLDRFLESMNLQHASELIDAIYLGPWDRAAIAGLAPLVLDTAGQKDEIALEIVQAQAHELAQTAVNAVRKIGLALDNLPIALAGGVFLGSELYRSLFLEALHHGGIVPGPIELVGDPVHGAIILAQRLADSSA